jgi:histidinol dehydrogenase
VPRVPPPWEAAATLARAEGLEAHARSAEWRVRK